MTTPAQKQEKLAEYFSQAAVLEAELSKVRRNIKQLVDQYTEQCN